MRLFGFEIARAKDFAPVYGSGPSLFGYLGDRVTNGWQKGIRPEAQKNLLAFSAVYACVSLIASDIAKLRIKLVSQTNGVWQEVTGNSPLRPVLVKPNSYQTRIQFLQQWLVYKLLHGNAYILKERDNRNVISALYPLDPRQVTPKVASDGSVWYDIKKDYLSGVNEDSMTVPQSEIIHDRAACLFHPLVGISPIYACALSGTQGLRIQQNAQEFFENRSSPGGQLTAPGTISDVTAERLKQTFETKFGVGSGGFGRLFVGGDGLKFEPITIPAADAQLIEQLRWTVEDVARCFRVPLHKIGAQGNITFNNVGQLNQDYYSQTLQELIESVELLLDEALGLPALGFGTELELEGLLRMDPSARADRLDKLKGYLEVNEGRASEGLPATKGGDAVYRLQQEFSLEALAKRDALPNPFVIDRPTTNPTPSGNGPPVEADPSNPPPAPSAPEANSGAKVIDARGIFRRALRKAA